ncbi:uncharacterized protein [Excalfactoria chinensis]|uniref:uncharacterized protein n=1 Tax=Excalfactoria chinensis TaxID=46218 RepID=UPI003B3A0A42
MADADKEQPGMSEDGPMVGHASGQTRSETEERVAVWDAVAAFIRDQLLVHKGVWIPTFGSFDIISKEIRMENKTVTLCWPVFQLASNLIAVHHLRSRRGSLPVDRKVEALKSSQVAAAASVSWKTAQKCIQSTVSLLSSCLQNGENVAVVLKDVGVLLIDGLTFQMKFYYDFLEKLSGKENFRRAVRKAPSLLDMGVSHVTPVASLVFSGCLVVFPKFQMELVPKLPPLIRRQSSGSFSGSGKATKVETLPPLTGGKKVRFDKTPTFIRRLSTASVDGGQLRKIKNRLRRESIACSVLPPIRAVHAAPQQPMSCQLQDHEETDNQEGLGRTRRVKFLDEEGEAEEAQHEGALPELQEDETPDKPSKLALRACDSVTLLRKRVEKSREEWEQAKEMAAATSRGETSLPEESCDRSGFLPPIREKTGSPTKKMAAATSHAALPTRVAVSLVGDSANGSDWLRLHAEAGAAAILRLGAARLSPHLAAAAACQSCAGSTETEPRHDGSGAEDGGAGAVRENGSGPGRGSGARRG